MSELGSGSEVASSPAETAETAVQPTGQAAAIQRREQELALHPERATDLEIASAITRNRAENTQAVGSGGMAAMRGEAPVPAPQAPAEASAPSTPDQDLSSQ